MTMDSALYASSQPAIYSRPSTANSQSLSSHSSERGSFYDNHIDSFERPRSRYTPPQRSRVPTLSSISDQEENNYRTTVNPSLQKTEPSTQTLARKKV